MKKNSFKSYERLKSKKLIDNLFASKGSVLFSKHLMLKFQNMESLDFVAKMGVTISKKKAKSAVDRNFYKRILKEAYRLQKSPLIEYLEANQKFLICFFVYLQVPPQKAAYHLIFEEMKELLDKLNRKLCSTK